MAADVDIGEIEAAAGRGDRNLALQLSLAAVKRGLHHPLTLGLVAEGLEASGRKAEALDLLHRATVMAPGDSQAWMRLGRALARMDRREEARTALERGLAEDPGDYRGLIDAGTACLRLGDLAAARAFFLRGSAVSPGAAEPLSALAVVAAIDDDFAEARAMAMRALALAPDLVSAQIAIARADAAEGAPALTADRLTRLLERSDLSDTQRIDAHDFRGEAFDALDRPVEAFADYEARNAILRRVHAPAFTAPGQESAVDRVGRLAGWFALAPAAPWRASAGQDWEGARTAARHVFLVGFPRSGTTLIEKVLASHPGIVALEETGLLAQAGHPLLESDAGLDRLAALGAADAEARRQGYWRGVRETLGEEVAGRILVDKLPLHTPSLPVVAKLFPGAQILFALRDPRDVVFSCFRRRFRINAAMYEFLTLSGVARYYDQVMALAEIYRDRLPLELHEVRHEAVVADFECEIRRILAFIGAPWDGAVRDFTAQARASNRILSARQVARGLNAEGVGQWRRYRAGLAPVAPILAPWVDHFGYPAA